MDGAPDDGTGEPVLGLDQVRGEIDALDGEIVRLLARRQHWVERAGRLKTDADAVRAPDRVAALVARVRTLATQAGGSPEVAERTYRAMVGAFIDLEMRVHRGTGRPGR